MRALTSRAKKKNLFWYTLYGKVEISEQTYRFARSGKQLRPFCEAAAVHCRSYSGPLQRAISDFGADHSFAQTVVKIKEHYGIDLPTSAAREHTYKHAAQIKQGEPGSAILPAGGVAQVIAETDGCMVPIVKTAEKGPKDKRKRRLLEWQEARLSLSYRMGSLHKQYQATLQEVAAAGRQLRACAVGVGAGEMSRIHGVGDGASWIVRQMEEQFGERGNYLIDFYHVSEYLARASEAISEQPDRWRRRQQERLKSNKVEEVLAALLPHLEEEQEGEGPGAVRGCWRYLRNRLAYLDYQGALEAGLPIGSGEVESGHRSVIQKRLKCSGGWWKEENAENMLALRTLRASGQWESYWAGVRQATA
jgi:hypothetical protein